MGIDTFCKPKRNYNCIFFAECTDDKDKGCKDYYIYETRGCYQTRLQQKIVARTTSAPCNGELIK